MRVILAAAILAAPMLGAPHSAQAANVVLRYVGKMSPCNGPTLYCKRLARLPKAFTFKLPGTACNGASTTVNNVVPVRYGDGVDKYPALAASGVTASVNGSVTLSPSCGIIDYALSVSGENPIVDPAPASYLLSISPTGGNFDLTTPFDDYYGPVTGTLVVGGPPAP